MDDEALQDERLQLRVMDYDTYSANDAIGKVHHHMCRYKIDYFYVNSIGIYMQYQLESFRANPGYFDSSRFFSAQSLQPSC